MITVSPYTDKANRFRIGNTYHFKMQGAGRSKKRNAAAYLLISTVN